MEVFREIRQTDSDKLVIDVPEEILRDRQSKVF